MTTPAQGVYLPADVRLMDRLAIDTGGIAGYTLMSRAGQAAFTIARERYPALRRWLVLCGAGNNAGDGYVIARLAREAGLDVEIVALTDPQRLTGDAARAWEECRASGGRAVEFSEAACQRAGLVIDAMLGTGLDRPLAGAYRQAVDVLAALTVPVMAIDVPTGLHAGSGAVMGAAVVADCTVTFVGRKQGLYLGQGPDHAGKIYFDDLGIPPAVVATAEPSLELFSGTALARLLRPRPATAHKGSFGHVVIIGGNHGMGGAVRLAAEAALRAGAGLVSVITRPDNVTAVTAYRPELMCHGSAQGELTADLLNRATVLAIGPGLGRDDWAERLLAAVLAAPQPKVLDADALNLLATQPVRRDDWILTPHPGEAARLLGSDTATVQAGRLEALTALGQRYGGVSILKGRGTLVGESGHRPYLIDGGNPGMASAGMGDVLTGLTAGLLAQYPAAQHRVAAAAAWVHAAAGDRAARQGERGLIATDLLGEIRSCLNPS